jgi:hypothetical protein
LQAGDLALDPLAGGTDEVKLLRSAGLEDDTL